MFVCAVLSICKSFAIVLSVISPYSVCGKWTFMYCNRLLASSICPFSAAVLNSSPRVPPLCTFCTFVPFDCKFLTKWTSHHRIFCHDSSSKRTYMFHSKCIEIFVLIYRGILCQTSCFSSKFHLCVKTLQGAVQHKSVNECSEVK